MLVAKRNNLIEMKVKYSRFRHNAKQTSFTSPTGPRRQGGEHEHAQYPTMMMSRPVEVAVAPKTSLS